MAQSDAKQQAATKARGGFLGGMILLGTFMNLVAVGGVAYFGRVMWNEINSLNAKVLELKQPEVAGNDSPVGKELQAKNLGVLFPLESFLVNLSSKQGPKFLQTQMEFELSDPSLEEELVRKKAAIRDSIIVLLSSHSYGTLREPAGIVDLRTEIRKKINNLLTTGRVTQVYFTQFHFN